MAMSLDSDQELRLVLIGKTGNGKSTLGNILLGRQLFPTGRSIASTTLKLVTESGNVQGKRLKVFDTPDVSNMDLSEDEAQREVAAWKTMTSPDAHATLLAVRCDVRYTREEHQIFLLLKKLWGGNSLCKRLVCPELQSVLKDAGRRYVVFNNNASEEEKTERVLQLLQVVENMSKFLDEDPVR
ncbi:hypothetical protein BaRGS_00004735 [Batillaria attramentaria]|uniref:AIG1-type G domain-containing protein n=1 Tax=Batillaria attramentaria TaxID=370345 RepID=A0ABD0LXY1_9CAEN